MPGAALTTAVPVPDLHAVLLLWDGVDPIVRLTAVPVVVVIGGAVCPLEVTLLVQGKWRKAAFAGGAPTPAQTPSPSPAPHSPATQGAAVTTQQRPNCSFGFYS